MLSPQDKSLFEALARLNADPGMQTVVNWMRESKDHHLEKSMQEQLPRDERMAHLDRAAVLTEMLDTMEKANDVVKEMDQASQ
jgi:hypothetical protein